LTFDVDALAAATLDGLGGNDTISIIDGAGSATLTTASIDGVDLANVFNNVEFLDFSGTDLTGGDTFDIGNDDIGGILSAGAGTLTIDVDQGKIALTDVSVLPQSGAVVPSDTITGSTSTGNWADGMQLMLNG
jgi:hypothetical protein